MSADKKQLTTATNCVSWKQFHPSRVFSRRNMWWFDKHFVGQSVVAVSSVPFSESIHPWIRRRARTLTHHNRFSWSCHWVNNTHVTRTYKDITYQISWIASLSNTYSVEESESISSFWYAMITPPPYLARRIFYRSRFGLERSSRKSGEPCYKYIGNELQFIWSISESQSIPNQAICSPQWLVLHHFLPSTREAWKRNMNQTIAPTKPGTFC